jgi:hypothetical protein
MHPSQKTLLEQAEALSSRIAATILWKYQDPDTGKVFYLTEKITTIRSPWTGKTFTTHPERASLAEVGLELREEAKTAGVPDKHQLKILKDTVKNPMKGKFLGGPSAEEAEETLREKFHFTDKQIQDLKKTAALDPAPSVGDETAVVVALDELMTAARAAKMAAEGGNTKRMFFRLLGVLNQVGVIGRAYDLPDVGLLMRVYKAFATMSGARPSTNFAANSK